MRRNSALRLFIDARDSCATCCQLLSRRYSSLNLISLDEGVFERYSLASIYHNERISENRRSRVLDVISKELMKINDRTPCRSCARVEDSEIKVKQTIRASRTDRSFLNNFYCPINHAQN